MDQKYRMINMILQSNDNFKLKYKNNKKFCIGSSFVYGDQVSNDETWPSVWRNWS